MSLLAPKPADSLTVELLAVVFSNPANGFVIARARQDKADADIITIVGTILEPRVGDVLAIEGEWAEHPRFGRQFQVKSYSQALPASVNGIRRYLGSGLLKGIGPRLAERLVKHFGDTVLDVLDQEPERLLEVKGVGKKNYADITASWEKQREVRSLLLFLQTHEVPVTFAGKIFALYGAASVAKLREDPYELAYEIRGVGFRTADAMALKLGFATDDPRRLQAAIIYALFTASDAGNLFYPAPELLDKVDQLLGGVERGALAEALTALSEKKRVRIESLPEQNIESAVYLGHLYRLERETAERILALAEHPASLNEEKVRSVLPLVERESGLKLSEEQRQAVAAACSAKVFCLTGGPGTGKTTITRMVVNLLDRLGLKVKLCAPTGRAAKRMSEATGRFAQTIHRLLGYGAANTFAQHEENKLKADCLVVDEASMVDAMLFVSLLRALPLTCRLILVGDVNQLPSVGPGNVLADLLESGCLATARLSHIFRQAAESSIVVNAHRVNQGEFPVHSHKPPPEADFYWVEQDDPAVVRDKILEYVCERIPRTYRFDPLRDIQVLTPMHKGEVGTVALNELLQERLNPSRIELVRGRQRFRPGDRVLQTRNNYDKDVFNGDLGFIVSVDPPNNEMLVDFDGREVGYGLEDLDELSLAYAVSVHKSQGSEYPVVVMPVVTQHFVMLRRNLIYTGLTRAKKLAVIIGGKRALALGLKNARAEQRYTHLRYRLQETFNS